MKKKYHQALDTDNFADMLDKEVKNLYNKFDTEGKKVRLVGVQVSSISSIDSKESLFEEKMEKKREELHKAIDRIRKRFGDSSIHRATANRPF